MTQKIYIVTFGCQMNVHDSNRMLMLMEHEGYTQTEIPEEADLILINTCSVREGPEHKVASQLGQFRPLKLARPDLILGVTGCVAQQKGAAFLKQFKYLDLVVGTDALMALPELVKAAKNGERKAQTTFQKREEYHFVDLKPTHSDSRFSAFLTAQVGCDKRCSYCIVPYLRGREVSRPSNEIITEANRMVLAGIKEITLLGQTVNSYVDRKNDCSFAQLLRKMSKIKGIDRIRFTSPHPKYFTNELMDTMAELDKVMNHTHLPIQSGSNAVLKHMRRQYTIEQFMEKLEYMRRVMPGFEVTTDIIVGYPTESDQDFQETLDAIKKIQFDSAFSFMYSPRPMTPIYESGEVLTNQDKKDRLHELQKLQQEISRTKTAALVGSTQKVLIEQKNDGRHKNQFSGRTPGNRKLFLDSLGEHKIGDIITATVIEGSVNSLKGTL